jgi:hypothetical protein
MEAAIRVIAKAHHRPVACFHCGSRFFILQIDHIDGRNQERKWYRGSSTPTHRLTATDRLNPLTLQLLCPNCHALKTFGERSILENLEDSIELVESIRLSFGERNG